MPGKAREGRPVIPRRRADKYPELGRSSDPCSADHLADFRGEAPFVPGESVWVRKEGQGAAVFTTAGKIGRLDKNDTAEVVACLDRGYSLVGQVEEIASGGRVRIRFRGIPETGH